MITTVLCNHFSWRNLDPHKQRGSRGTKPRPPPPDINPHPHDQADGVESSSICQRQQEDIRLFLDMLYGNGTGYCHVIWGEGWYRDDKGKLRLRSWSETRERHAFAYPAQADEA